MKREPAAQRGRRLLAALCAAACLMSATSLVSGVRSAHAADNPPFPCRSSCPTTSPTDSPTPVCFYPELCPPSPSPTPDVIVVSPVPADPSPSPSTPSYLVGINPTPSPTPATTDSISSPVPVGGGFVDQLPTPTAAPTVANANDLAPHSSGLPLPFIAVGALLILGAVGSLLYAVVPRNKPIFESARRTGPTSPVMFTPYGPDAPGSNILRAPQGPRPGQGKPS